MCASIGSAIIVVTYVVGSARVFMESEQMDAFLKSNGGLDTK